jgi:hypothetical protein
MAWMLLNATDMRVSLLQIFRSSNWRITTFGVIGSRIWKWEYENFQCSSSLSPLQSSQYTINTITIIILPSLLPLPINMSFSQRIEEWENERGMCSFWFCLVSIEKGYPLIVRMKPVFQCSLSSGSLIWKLSWCSAYDCQYILTGCSDGNILTH